MNYLFVKAVKSKPFMLERYNVPLYELFWEDCKREVILLPEHTRGAYRKADAIARNYFRAEELLSPLGNDSHWYRQIPCRPRSTTILYRTLYADRPSGYPREGIIWRYDLQLVIGE